MRAPPSSEKDQARDRPSRSFELGKSLPYYDGKGMAETLVYEGASPDSMAHTIRRHDGTCLTFHDSYLRLKLQPDLSNILSTPLALRNEVDVGISKEKTQTMARPRILTPIQQELMYWHHQLYHLSFPKNI